MKKLPDALVAETITVSVPFYDTDPMGVTWHGNYLKYFELARCALLDKIDFGYRRMTEYGYAWPIVDIRVKYVKSSLFEQALSVWAGIVEYENRLKIEYRIYDQDTGEIVTTGFTIQIAIDLRTKDMCFESPDALKQRIELVKSQ
ncbi:MAG: acyl-CoA thioesterase [Gammaproteobacteria bacterium]|nr:acyl-CoA thioesterase [Gammaproteobacteria bacterium]